MIQAFPFDPNPEWSKFYADGDEILEYMEKIVTKWDLDRDIQFNTKVVALNWLEDQGKWKIRVRKDGQETDEFADVLVSAQGFLRYVATTHTSRRLTRNAAQSMEMARHSWHPRLQGSQMPLRLLGSFIRLLEQAHRRDR